MRRYEETTVQSVVRSDSGRRDRKYRACLEHREALAILNEPCADLGRPIPVADGFTGDVITLDAAIDSMFPNGRRLGGGSALNRNQVNVNTAPISPIVAGDPNAELAKSVEVNDKEFPFLAPAHQGL